MYDGNVWEWDIYWLIYGSFGMPDVLSEVQNACILAYAKGNILNLLDHQLDDGYIPRPRPCHAHG